MKNLSPAHARIPETSAPVLRHRLGEWFDQHARDLPWRHNRTAYRVAVSEFMLQQTQVKTVLPYYERWMLRFPDFESLAEANENEVLSYWQGLGYYSRARNLLTLARTVVAMPELPTTAAAWITLPGVGPYTAAAIATFSAREAVAVVDGNVARVLARLTGQDQEFPDKNTVITHFRPLAQSFLDPENPARHNEAMMELGATVCLPRRPACTICPLRKHCRGQPYAEDIPRVVKATRSQHTVDRILCFTEGCVLLERHPENRSRLAGLLEIPERSRVPLPPQAETAPPVTKRRSIGRDDFREKIAVCTGITPAPLPDGLEWVSLTRLCEFPLAGPHRRWIEELKWHDSTVYSKI